MKWFKLFLIGFITCISVSSRADHVVGGNISYQCLGGDNYGITLSFYEQCYGATPPLTENIFFFPTSGSCLAFSAFLPINVITVTEISDLCPSEFANSACNGGSSQLGTNLVTYYVEVYLDPSCSWDIVWTGTDWYDFQNIDPSSFPNTYFLTHLDPSFGCNDSPIISTPVPIPYVCVGDAVSHQITVNAPAGYTYDFALTNVLSDGGASVPYLAGYSGSSPIPGLTLDPATGVIDFVAPALFGTAEFEIYVVGVQVNLYDASGNLVSTLLETFSFVVRLCNDFPVTFTIPEIISAHPDVTVIGNNEVNLCVGDSLCLTVEATSANAFRNITLSSDFETLFSGGIFTTTGLNPAVGEMCVLVNESMIGTTVVAVDAIDDACPIPHTDQINLIVHVLPSMELSVLDTVVCNGQQLDIVATGDISFSWNMVGLTTDPGFVQGSPSQSINPIEPFIVEVIADNATSVCNYRDTLTVDVSLWSLTGLVNDETCNGNDGAIDLTVSGGTGTYNFNWNTGSYLTEDLSGIVGGTTYSVEVTNNGTSNGQPYTCIETTSFSVGTSPPPSGSISGDITICEGNCADILFNLSGTAPFNVVLVNQATGVLESTLPVSNGDVFQVCPLVTTTYELQSITDSNIPQCSYTVVSTVTVLVLPIPTVTLVNPGSLCSGDNTDVGVNITPLGTFNLDYSIDLAPQGTFAVTNGDVINLNVSDPSTQLSITNIEYQSAPLCSNNAAVDLVINVNPIPTAVLSGATTICNGSDVTLHMSLTGTGPWEMSWTENGLTQTPFVVNVAEYDWLIFPAPTVNTTYCLTQVIDQGTGCSDILNSCVDVVVNPNPTGTLTANGTICFGDVYDISLNLGSNGPFSVVVVDAANNPVSGIPLSVNNGDIFQVNPGVSETYCLSEVTDINGCISVANSCVDVLVNSLPSVDITGSAEICVGDCYDLMVNNLVGVGPFNMGWEMYATSSGVMLSSGTELGIVNGDIIQFCPTEDVYIITTTLSDSQNPNCSSNIVPGQFDLTVHNYCTVEISQDYSICAGESPILTFCFQNFNLNDQLDVNLDNGQGFSILGSDLVGGCWNILANLTDPNLSQTYSIINFSNSQNPCTQIILGTTTISVNPIPTASLLSDMTICSGAAALLSINIPTIGGPFDVSIQFGADAPIDYFNVVDGDIFTFTPTTSGSYTLTTITDNSLTTACIGNPMSQVLVNLAETPSLLLPVDTICANTGDSYQIEFQIVNGDSNSYVVTPTLGNDPGGSDPQIGAPYLYTSGIIPTGQGEIWELTDQFGCGPTLITIDPFTCPIITYSGTLDLTAMYICNNGILSVTNNNDEILDNNDVLNFVIQSQSNAGILGIVYDVSTTGIWNSIDLIPGILDYGLEYYVSMLAGNDLDGDGIIDDFLDPANSISEGVPITFLEIPTAIISGGGTVCEGIQADIQIDFTGSPNYNFEMLLDGVAQGPISDYGLNSITIPVASAGIYSLSYVDNTFCSGTVAGQSEVIVNPNPTAIFGADASICSGDSFDFDVALTGSSPWNIVVEYDNGISTTQTNLNAIAVSPAVFNANSEGFYAVSYLIDGNGCEFMGNSNAAYLTVLDLPTASFAFGDTSFCAGSNIDLELNLTGGGNWVIDYSLDGVPGSWLSNNPNYLQNITTGGIYCIEGVGDNNNCANFTQSCINVYETPIPVADAGPDIFICSNEISLIGTLDIPNLSYDWSGDIDLLDNTTIAQPSAVIINTSIANQVYVLNLLVTEGECTGNDNMQITVYPQTNAFAGDDQNICYGEAYQLGGTGGLSCVWENGISFVDPTDICNPVVQPQVTTEYVVTVTDGNTCSYSDTINLFVPAEYVLDVISTPSVCVGICDAIIEITPSGGWGSSYAMLWGNTLSSFSEIDVCAGDYSYEVSDSLGCLISGTIAIGEYIQNFIDDVSINPPLCFGFDTGLITTLDNEGISYSIDGANVNNTGMWTGLSSGTYTIESTDGFGCLADTTVSFVSASPEIFFSTAFDTTLVCVDVATLFGANASGGTPGFNYSWFDDIPPLGNNLGSGPDISITPNNSPYQVFVFATDNLGCSSDTLVMVTVYDLPLEVIAQPDIEICQGDCVDLTSEASGGNGTYNYSWYQLDVFGDILLGNSSGQTECPMQDQIYVVMLEDNCQVLTTDTVNVIVHETPIVMFNAESYTGCYPLTINFNNLTNPSLSDNCVWDLDNGTVLPGCGNLSYTYLNEGVYLPTLMVSSAFGCTSIATLGIPIEVYGHPASNFYWEPVPITTLDNEVQFINTSTGAISYNWEIAGFETSQLVDPSYNFPPLDLAYYPICLQAINEYGCVDTLCQDLFMESELLLYAPNAFTPDQDGLNDVFLPEISGISKDEYIFTVFDRWGHKVFQSTEIGVPWVGEFQSGEHFVQDDVYVWIIEARELATGDMKRFYGNVMMAR